MIKSRKKVLKVLSHVTHKSQVCSGINNNYEEF